jgi:hypothetical protein
MITYLYLIIAVVWFITFNVPIIVAFKGTFVNVLSANGIQINSPIYKPLNDTWQVTVSYTTEEKAFMVPLMRNQQVLNDTIVPPNAQVGICVLGDMARSYVNIYFSRYLSAIDVLDCGSYVPTDSSIRMFSHYSAITEEFVTWMTNDVRVWYLAIGDTNTYVMEITNRVLQNSWLTRSQLSSVPSSRDAGIMSKVIDIDFAFILPLPINKVDVVVSEHHIVFDDATKYDPLLHASLYTGNAQACLDTYKPLYALWHVRDIHTNDTCNWFCMNNFYPYPPFPNMTDNNTMCIPVPLYGGAITFNTILNICCATDEYYPTLNALYDTFTAIAFVSNRSLSITEREPAVLGTCMTAYLDMIFYTSDERNNASMQTNLIWDDFNHTTSLLYSHECTNMSVISTSAIVRLSPVIRRPPIMPFRDFIIISLWTASVMTVFMSCLLYTLCTMKPIRFKRKTFTKI